MAIIMKIEGACSLCWRPIPCVAENCWLGAPADSAEPADLPLSRFGGSGRLTGAVSYRAPFRFDLCKACTVLQFHNLVAQQCCALVLQARGRDLHLLFQFTKHLGDIEIAATLSDDRFFKFPAPEQSMQAFLYSPADAGGRYSIGFIVLDLPGSTVFG